MSANANRILKGKLAGKHDDIGFERVFASPENVYFLGVSNSGLIKQAFVIFDRRGRMLKRQPHDLRQVHYSAISKTLIRRWYDVVPAHESGSWLPE